MARRRDDVTSMLDMCVATCLSVWGCQQQGRAQSATTTMAVQRRPPQGPHGQTTGTPPRVSRRPAGGSTWCVSGRVSHRIRPTRPRRPLGGAACGSRGARRLHHSAWWSPPSLPHSARRGPGEKWQQSLAFPALPRGGLGTQSCPLPVLKHGPRSPWSLPRPMVVRTASHRSSAW